MGLRPRLEKLEARHPPRTHHLPVVRIPGTIAHADWEAYLATLPCACGARQCPRRTIGVALPEKLSVEAWERTYRHRRNA